MGECPRPTGERPRGRPAPIYTQGILRGVWGCGKDENGNG
nr:MAG TPA: hypothetical protein [Caudoviricetes sp.]